MALLLPLIVVAALAPRLNPVCNHLSQLTVQAATARADIARADIDVWLKRRHDLIPNLVRTVIQARGAAMAAGGPAQRQQAEQRRAASIDQLFALAEACPPLRVVESVQSLQGDLAGIEEVPQHARRNSNAIVRDRNMAIVRFP
jgi:LemA protein